MVCVKSMTREPPFDIRFQTPACFLLLGPSGSGKTHWLLTLLRNHATYFKKPLGVVYYFYLEDDKTHDQFKAIPGLTVHMMKGAPKTLEDVKDLLNRHSLNEVKTLIFDDLYNENIDYLKTLFTVTSSHLNVSIFLLGQSIFKDPRLRQLSLNTQYMIVFKNPRDKLTFSTLGSQVAPGRAPLVRQAIDHATQRPHGYLLFDFTQNIPEILRWRTNIFLTPSTVYNVY